MNRSAALIEAGALKRLFIASRPLSRPRLHWVGGPTATAHSPKQTPDVTAHRSEQPRSHSSGWLNA
eukprot:6502434-Alexandrium_andersonii.AAC.1